MQIITITQGKSVDAKGIVYGTLIKVEVILILIINQ